ncbi:hypothetical protein GF359_10805 [candidate division WOR-3 bacterium]|uniref:Uncharacterized protein n=1 Tax=candidate division WOR-3 bacterium TaxID=2052148 RepID=A0A9D5KDV1_UNCW3|nr:hypothetical protein [candidate division WOR-3 bacterium]MBD3365691.1 hypothetical protein [candidate division WOR-3 bacterium]
MSRKKRTVKKLFNIIKIRIYRITKEVFSYSKKIYQKYEKEFNLAIVLLFLYPVLHFVLGVGWFGVRYLFYHFFEERLEQHIHLSGDVNWVVIGTDTAGYKEGKWIKTAYVPTTNLEVSGECEVAMFLDSLTIPSAQNFEVIDNVNVYCDPLGLDTGYV